MLDGINTELEVVHELGATSKVISTTTKILKPAGYVAIGVNTYIDARELYHGDISVERFSYRTAGTAAGIGVAAYFGAIPGACAGGLFYVGEKCWDGITLFIDKVSEAAGKIQSGEWIPGAN